MCFLFWSFLFSSISICSLSFISWYFFLSSFLPSFLNFLPSLLACLHLAYFILYSLAYFLLSLSLSLCVSLSVSYSLSLSLTHTHTHTLEHSHTHASLSMQKPLPIVGMELDSYEMPSATVYAPAHMNIKDLGISAEARATLLKTSPDSSVNGNSVRSNTSLLPSKSKWIKII